MGQEDQQLGRKAEGEAEDSKNKLELVKKKSNLILITSGLNDPSSAEELVLFATHCRYT